MTFDNPAYRLHGVLSRFRENASASRSVHDCWQLALQCGDKDLAACFAAALSLIPEIRSRVESLDVGHQLALVDRYEESWRRPFLSPDRTLVQGSQQMVDGDSLLALYSLAAILAAHSAPVVVADAEQSETLLRLVSEARQAVREDGDLPQALRSLLLDRLDDIQWAVEHYDIRGADGLQAALDRLSAQVVRTSGSSSTTSWRKKTGKALMFGWMVLSQADAVFASLDALAPVVTEALGWAEEAGELMAPDNLALPPGPTEDAPADPEIVDGEIVDDDEV